VLEGFGTRFQLTLGRALNLLTRDVLYQLACVGDLPLPQPSPPSGTKGDRKSDSPLSTNTSKLSSSLVSQNETPRVIAGSRRVRKEPLSIHQMQQLQTPLPPHQQSQAAPRPSAMPLPPSQQSPSQSRSHSQIRPNESQQTTSVIPPFNNTNPNMFALPVYSNDLGRLPLHGHVTFSDLSQSQLDPETSYSYTAPQPASHAGTSGMSSSYGPHYPPAPAPKQQPYPHYHHAPQGILGGEFPSASEASSVAQNPYGMDAGLATGMLFDAMADQWTSTYGLGPIHSSIPGMGSGSMASTAPQPSVDSSMEDAYRGMGTETTPGPSGGQYQHQHQGVPRQQGELALSYPFVLDDDAETIWSTAPTGDQCVISISVGMRCYLPIVFFFLYRMDQWGTYLANIGELMQDGHQHPSM